METPKKRKRWPGQGEWDKENVTTLGCKVKKEEAIAFKEYSTKQGKTANTVLKEYVIKCIEQEISPE